MKYGVYFGSKKKQEWFGDSKTIEGGNSIIKDWCEEVFKKKEKEVKRFESVKRVRTELKNKWLTKYESLIVENNIDLTSFFKFMEIIDTINSENIQILKELKDTLQFESLP